MWLVMALVEIIRDALKLQALRRMEGGSLTEEEIERVGNALMELDTAIEEIIREQGIREAVRSVRDGLDRVVDDILEGGGRNAECRMRQAVGDER